MQIDNIAENLPKNQYEQIDSANNQIYHLLSLSGIFDQKINNRSNNGY